MPSVVTLNAAPPQKPEAEAALIGCMWEFPEQIDDVLATVTPEMIYHHPYRSVFNALVAMHRAEEPISRNTLALKLGGRKAGGYEEATMYLVHLEKDYGWFASPTHYAAIVANEYLRREYISRGTAMIEAAHATDNTVDDVKALAEDIGLVDQRKPENIVSLGPEVHQVANIALDRCGDNSRDAYGIMSGIRAIDALTLGFQGSTVTVIAARPGVGKTALGLQFAVHACQSGKKAVIFSGEMSARQLVRRVAGHLADIDHNKFITGNFTHDEMQRIAPAVTASDRLDMIVVDANGMKPSQMRSVIQREKADVAVVDYIQIMQPEQPSRSSREVDVASISRGLKQIAKKFDIPILSLCQLNRDGANGAPTLTNLRESDAIGNDADMVIMLYRSPDDISEPTRRIVNWRAEKNRHGRCDGGKFWFYGATNKFIPIDDEYGDDI